MFTIVLTIVLFIPLAGIAAVLSSGMSAMELTEMGVRLDDPALGYHGAH